jgi:putative transposase
MTVHILLLWAAGWTMFMCFSNYNPLAVAEQMRMLKATSSKWINDNKLVKEKFQWQEGYGAFSYSRSQRNSVIKYISQQEAHHKKKTFKEEYMELLNKFEIRFEDKYVFDFYD